MDKTLQEIQSLIESLNHYTTLYDKGEPIISDKEWDDMYFKLVDLEKETGLILEGSPTKNIHFTTAKTLERVKHNHKMLSLNKTKSIEEVYDFLDGEKALCMYKMDGLTCSLKYLNGRLISAETRGNGIYGEDVLHNARTISSIPRRIQYTGDLVLDGEIICTYNDFKSFSENYRNPRNFAAGSIRLLNAKECASRKLTFVVWDVIQGYGDINSLNDKLDEVEKLGFTIVPKYEVYNDIDAIEAEAKESNYPVDGLVFKFDDITYGKSLGETEHHFKNAIAYKFYDETYSTRLLNIEWSMGRTGTLTPVAVFTPVEIDGTMVERASLHNLNILEQTLGRIPFVGQHLEIIKSNMIIPQVYSAEENYKPNSCVIYTPKMCPICESELKIELSETGNKTLVCPNSECQGKLLNKLEHFCSKKGLDIKGLSKSTLNKFFYLGWINSISDLYNLYLREKLIIKQPGFGLKSVKNILTSIEDSKTNSYLHQFISALGIPQIGTGQAKELCKHFKTWDEFQNAIAQKYDFSTLNNFGPVANKSIYAFDFTEANKMASMFSFVQEEEQEKTIEQKCDGFKFVITGKLKHFKNRKELIAAIESAGGTIGKAVTSHTNYLINNDLSSTSTKMLDAKKYNIPVITEKEFMEKFI